MSTGEAERPTASADVAAADVAADVAAATGRDWLGLAMLMLGAFVAQIDFFIVNVALPSIKADLGTSLSQIQLISVSFSLALGVLVVTGGRLGDLFGRRRIFLIGLAGLAVSSLLCGLAWSGWALVFARVLQGAAAALVMPQAIGSIHAMFGGADRERAFSLFSMSLGAAWISGILLGGALTQADIGHLGWRLIFLINVPLAVLATVGTLLWVAESRPPTATNTDLAGMAALAVTIGLSVFPLIQGRQAGWPPWTFACLALAVAGAVAFVRIERRVLLRGGAPVVPPDLFRIPTFRLGAVVIVVFYLGPPGFWLLTTLYLQSVLGFSPVSAAMSVLAFGVVFVAASSVLRRIKARIGEGVVIVGVAVMIVGVLMLAFAVHHYGTALTIVDTVPGMALFGFGHAMVTSPLYELLLRNVSGRVSATVTGVFTTLQIIAQVISVALIVIIFGAFLNHDLGTVVPKRAPQLVSALHLPAGDANAAMAAFRSCTDAAATNLATGSAAHCAVEPRWQAAVEQATTQTVAAAAQRSFVWTLGFTLLVVLASGTIMALSRTRRRPAAQRDADP